MTGCWKHLQIEFSGLLGTNLMTRTSQMIWLSSPLFFVQLLHWLYSSEFFFFFSNMGVVIFGHSFGFCDSLSLSVSATIRVSSLFIFIFEITVTPHKTKPDTTDFYCWQSDTTPLSFLSFILQAWKMLMSDDGASKYKVTFCFSLLCRLCVICQCACMCVIVRACVCMFYERMWASDSNTRL